MFRTNVPWIEYRRRPSCKYLQLRCASTTQSVLAFARRLRVHYPPFCRTFTPSFNYSNMCLISDLSTSHGWKHTQHIHIQPYEQVHTIISTSHLPFKYIHTNPYTIPFLRPSVGRFGWQTSVHVHRWKGDGLLIHYSGTLSCKNFAFERRLIGGAVSPFISFLGTQRNNRFPLHSCLENDGWVEGWNSHMVGSCRSMTTHVIHKELRSTPISYNGHDMLAVPFIFIQLHAVGYFMICLNKLKPYRTLELHDWIFRIIKRLRYKSSQLDDVVSLIKVAKLDVTNIITPNCRAATSVSSDYSATQATQATHTQTRAHIPSRLVRTIIRCPCAVDAAVVIRLWRAMQCTSWTLPQRVIA